MKENIIKAIIILCILITIFVSLFLYFQKTLFTSKYNNSRINELKAGADSIKVMGKRGVFGPQWESNSKVKKAIELLSNEVLDEEVLLIHATVWPPTNDELSDPIVRNCPRLVFWIVDELEKVIFFNYSNTDDPCDFGTGLFTKRGYHLFIGEPIASCYWYLYLKCDDPNMMVYPELIKLEHYMCQPDAILRLPINYWNAMLSCRGQLILRDNKNLELARINLIPPADPNARKILESLMINMPDTKNDPNYSFK